ncbi:PadR family transcriptional regulator [Sinosporangium siamense]|uniref:Transcription regulator PadR N-terminal domain-containing protein n=1 Tax=Sinosporangium siamense TaxID=1367973 RepID=A0A919RJ33_9ACTN|nr:helix-turn-helix transcriptional regulator [Sinosporangium siamense]GII93740.1 hypothetical protein Ssi02_39710 [Sinosporangium siamense]
MNVDTEDGRLDEALLVVLRGGPMHGHAIVEALRERNGGALGTPIGAVYPALRRLERAGAVVGAWGTAGGRRRRFYRLASGGAASGSPRRAAPGGVWGGEAFGPAC